MQAYDFILIGTGQASFTILSELIPTGTRIAVIEGGRFGGTCVNYGCTPTKTLVAAARAAYMARRANDFGVVLPGDGNHHIEDIRVDWQHGIKRALDNRQGTNEWMDGFLDENVDLYRGWAQFESEKTVRINDDVIEGETIYIHTGASPRVPDIPGIDSVPYLTSTNLLELPDLPEHIVIVGGSYIGLEYSQIFRRFGAQVTVIEHSDQIMTREDPDIAQIAREVLEGEGINFVTGASVTRVANNNGGVDVIVEQGGAEHAIHGSHLLLAVGRTPNTANLGLEKAGIETTERGYVKVDEHLSTNVPGVFAVGDVNGHGAFTHTSVNDGEIILNNLNGGDRSVNDRFLTYALFMDPPLGRVGMNETMAKQSDRKLLMGTMDMASISRAKEKDETAGKVKVIVDAETDTFVGATVFGTGGDEIINMFTIAMYTGVPCRTFRDSVLVHPTVAELLPYIIRDMKPVN
ncbi:MAG: mercuric reductase [Chloroflexota bacterium]